MKVGDKVRYYLCISKVHSYYVGIGHLDNNKFIEVGWESKIINIFNNPEEVKKYRLILNTKEDLELYPWVQLEAAPTPAIAPSICLELISVGEPAKIPCNCPTFDVVNFGCKFKEIHY